LKAHRLKSFVWVVNDERRMNQLVRAGVDGLITERLDVMRLLGTGKGAGR
jgi:glycerophosphoryl diester phosphodiesterase